MQTWYLQATTDPSPICKDHPGYIRYMLEINGCFKTHEKFLTASERASTSA